MARKTAVIYDDDAPELTDAERAEFRPAAEVMTGRDLAAAMSARKRGRPPAAAPKVPVTIRLDAATVAAFRATGAGWQTRINGILRRVAPREGVSMWISRDPLTGAVLGKAKPSGRTSRRAGAGKARA